MNRIKFSILVALFFFCLPGFCEVEVNSVYPTCSKEGQLLCPSGYEPSCKEEEDLVKTEPKCFFYIDKHVPCCMKFTGIKKLDLGLEKLMLSPNTMVKIIGGGETYTLNREAIFCKKI